MPKKLPHELRAPYDEARLTDYQIAAVNEQGSGRVFITTRPIAQGVEVVV